MKTRQSSVLLVLVLAAATAQALPARQQSIPFTGQASNSSPQIDRRADLYYDITMGHLYARQYVTTNNSDDATRAIDFYKKAYALDPTSQVVGEQLAEIYFLSQRTPEAIKEARDVLRRDPANLPVRRLLVRIYIRSLGELRDTTEQQAMVGQAIDQL
jgi:lipopolysaccharide biosynthesis regulator YciM